MQELGMPSAEAERLIGFAEGVWPAEACGLLLAWPAGGRQPGRREVVRGVPCRNVHRRPRCGYELSPRDFLRWDRVAARCGLTILGIWHSHPRGGAAPSATDRAQAWRGWIYLILAVGSDGGRQARAWCWTVSGCREVGVVRSGP